MVVNPRLQVPVVWIACRAELADTHKLQADHTDPPLPVIQARTPTRFAKRPKRLGVVSFVHRFGAALNEHPHFHCCVIDGVFEPALGDDEAVTFREAALSDADTQRVQVLVRQRVLRWFARQRRIVDPTRVFDLQRGSSSFPETVNRSKRRGTASLRGADDGLGDCRKVDPVIWGKNGARTSVPDARSLGPGMRRELDYQLTRWSNISQAGGPRLGDSFSFS